ncbi:MAG: V-type ATP synthase subunit E [Acidilobus sp.]
MSVSGDPNKVAEVVIEKAISQLNSQLDEALSAALKLLEGSYAKALNNLRSTIDRKAEELTELLRSKAAEADLQVKLKEEAIKAEETSKVMEEAIRRLKGDRGDWYVKFLRRVLESLSAESEQYGGFIIKCAAEDQPLVRELIKSYRGLELSDEPAMVVGGVVATSKDGTVKLDYTIDQIIKENETMLRGLASRQLFEVT